MNNDSQLAAGAASVPSPWPGAAQESAAESAMSTLHKLTRTWTSSTASSDAGCVHAPTQASSPQSHTPATAALASTRAAHDVGPTPVNRVGRGPQSSCEAPPTDHAICVHPSNNRAAEPLLDTSSATRLATNALLRHVV